jgi:AraC-like DNA-binding protein
MASLQSIFNELVGEEVCFAAVEMTHDNPAADHGEFRRLFRCAIFCGMPRNAVLLPESLLATALPYPQPEYSALFRDMCRQSMASLLEERGLLELIKDWIVAQPGRVPTLAEVAGHFTLSPRTLRRHLRAAGVSYRGLVDEVRYASARRYLCSTTLTIDAIASQLGYADARSFRTAFRRWAGGTPSDYRRVS